MKIDNNSLTHSTWNCKYHIVFAPKYRRRVIYGKIRMDMGKIIRILCEQKEIGPLKWYPEKEMRLMDHSAGL